MPRLYFITAGSVIYRGEDGKRTSLGPGRCWGASDVLSLQAERNAFRAVAASFLHVQWIGPEQLRSLRQVHREPFRHLRLWAMLHDVATHLVRSMKKMPPALRKADIAGSGDVVCVTLSPWVAGSETGTPRSDGYIADPARAVLTIGGGKRLVRFRDTDLTKVWGEAAIDSAFLGKPLQVEEIDDSKVGGTVRLSDGRTLPNPRLLDDYSEARSNASGSAAPVAGGSTSALLSWSMASVREAPTRELWSLKRAIDTVLEEKQTESERALHAQARAVSVSAPSSLFSA